MQILNRISYWFVGLAVAIAVSLIVLTVEAISLSPARAETVQCAGVADLLAQLDSAYHERQLFTGQMGQGATLVITANPSQTSWTALVIGSDGKACIAALGTGWRAGDAPGPPLLGTEG